MHEQEYRLPDGNRIIEDFGFSSSDFRFKVTKIPAEGSPAEVSVTRYKGSEAHVIIPKEIFGCRITSVGKSAFAGCKQLVSVTVPEGVRSIDGWAFYACTNLEDVDLPEGLESIGRCAFRSCHGLTDVTVPDSVHEIRDWAFQCCYSLRRVRLPAALTYLDFYAFRRCDKLESLEIIGAGIHHMTDDGLLYNTDRHELIMCPEGKKGEVRIKEGTLEVCPGAFCRCFLVTSVYIPATVVRIHKWTFNICSSLERITIPYEACRRMKPLIRSCLKNSVIVNKIK